MKLNKFIYMSDGFYVYKIDDGYSVTDQYGYIIKTAKTLKTCDSYVQKQLETRRAAERYAIEKINEEHTRNRGI